MDRSSLLNYGDLCRDENRHRSLADVTAVISFHRVQILGSVRRGDMKTVTLVIDDETFAGLRKQAAARGLSVEQWLKATIANATVEASPLVDLPIKERLQRFDQATLTLERMNVGSGGMLDDTRETIYGDRGL